MNFLLTLLPPPSYSSPFFLFPSSSPFLPLPFFLSIPSLFSLLFPSSLSRSSHSFHRMLTNEDEQVDFWELVQLYTERLFLIPSLPSGMLAMVSGMVHIQQREG